MKLRSFHRVYGLMLCFRLLTLGSFGVLMAAAQHVNPTAYSMPNGDAGAAGLLYRDDIYRGTGDPRQDRSPLSGGLGQLTDGNTGCTDDPTTDCGPGAGYEWVGWRIDPTLTFQFGERCDFKVVRIHTANWPDTGAPIWKTATVSISDDGLTFRNFTIRTITSEEVQSRKARYIDIPVRGSGRFVRITLARSAPDAWILISEVSFEGTVSKDQAPPAKAR